MKKRAFDKDDLGQPLKKTKSGKFIAYTVLTPYGGEATFNTKQAAMFDHRWNKRNKVPSYVGVFEWTKDGDCDIVNALASYRSDEI